MTVAAVIASYGPSGRSLDCVRSLLDAVTKPDFVVIVHNGPEPFAVNHEVSRATVHSVEAEGAAGVVRVIEPLQNLGYSGALRLGISALAESSVSVDYVWLLNNDLVVHRNALASLLKASRHSPRVGLWGSTICDDPTFSRIAAVGVRYSHLTTRRRPVFAGWSVSDALNEQADPSFDFIPGSSMFMAREVYERSGGLSPAYFLYFEELDLAARVRAAGLEVRWCRDALVAHEGGATTGSYRERESRPTIVAYHAMRSAVIYTLKYRRVALPTVLVSRLLVNVLFNLLRGDRRTANAAMRGCVDGLRTGLRSGVMS
jgi:GT2 family glycosyltransferase